jgi:signal transduction histidine kinase
VTFDLLEGSVRLLAEKERLEADNGRLAQRERQRAELLARVSHDLRTPLTGIIGFAELMQGDAGDGAAGERRRECLAAIRRNGLSLLGLINDLLDVASVERGHFTVRREPVALQALLDDVRAATAPHLAASGCTVIWPRREALAGLVVELDRRRIGQAVVNLIDNARRACAQGGGRIAIALDQDGDDIVLSVSDTGPGVAEADRERIFQPFVRVDLPGQGAPGIGLGLAIVQAVVDLHGGRIELDSRPGRGARFALVIPCRPHTIPTQGATPPT